MDYTLTLAASTTPLSTAHLAAVTDFLDKQNLPLAGNPHWLDPHRAADLILPQRLNRDQIRALRSQLEGDRIDFFIQPSAGRQKKLLLSDMDSTIIANETLDDLAETIGQGDACRAITERTMRGEADLVTAIRERVALLKGMPLSILEKTLAAVTYNPGAEQLVRGMSGQGAFCVLVSSGFTFFTGGVAKAMGFHRHHGNILEIENGSLNGSVRDPILDKHSKENFLDYYLDDLGLEETESLAIGDGSNDLLMLQAAGLGIGFHPKPLLIDAIDNLILYGDLTAALYAQGLTPNLH